MTLSCPAFSSRVLMKPRILLLTLSVLAACGGSGSEQPRPTPITQARQRDNGTQVTVEGYVTVPPVALQDNTGGIYEKLEGSQQVGPKDVRTADVNEATEGLLVRVSGNETRAPQEELPYGYELYIDDGSGEMQVYIHGSAGFDPDTLRALTVGRHRQVTGLLGTVRNHP